MAVSVFGPSPASVARETTSPGAETAARFGFWIAILLSVMGAAGFLLGIFTPPRSGPWCTVNCTAYPYVDASRFFPRDYFWMAPAVLLAPLFLAVAACVHFCVPAQRRVFSLLATCAATLAAGFIALDYFVQVVVVQASLLQHETDGVALFTQYNPRGLFLAVEDIGYLMMATGFLLLAMAVPRQQRCAAGLRRSLGVSGGLTWLSFIALGAHYGADMGMPFELAAVTLVWIGLVPTGILTAMWFRGVSGPSSRGRRP